MISEEIWERAKNKLFTTYADSTCLEICKNLIKDFEELYPQKYYTDLEEFAKESFYEDFYEKDNKETIFVSTIHKSKGREFDTVYMMINENLITTDKERRKIYVGITRAKESLYIHCNMKVFQEEIFPEVVHVIDEKIYQEPKEICLQLTLKDVFLDFFKEKEMEKLVSKLHSGSSLLISNNSLYIKTQEGERTVVVFSKAFAEKIIQLRRKGYEPYFAMVRFVVGWKRKSEERETAVLLPDIWFRKQ